MAHAASWLALPSCADGDGSDGSDLAAGSDTESPSSDGDELELPLSAFSSDIGNAICDSWLHFAGSEALQQSVPSPRMKSIYDTMRVPVNTEVLTCEAAVGMTPGTFGKRTEGIRAWAARKLSQEATTTSSTTHAGCALACATTQPPSTNNSTASGSGTTCAGCVCMVPSMEATCMVATHMVPTASGSGTARAGRACMVPRMEATSMVATSSAQLGDAHARNLSTEDAAAARTARELMDAMPNELAFHAASAVPHQQRVQNRLRHLERCGVDSLRLAKTALDAWKVFCVRHSIHQYGAGICDAEMAQWFLGEEDSAARARARDSAGSATGGSVEISRANGMRWLHANVGCPFGAFKELAVRKSSSRPGRQVEESYAEMYEVAAMAHLLIVALAYEGIACIFIRAWAAAAYSVCVASLRMVDGLRSPPPTACS